MYTPDALLELHARAHANLQDLLAHCGELTAEELDRAHAGFGYPSVRLQLHHGLGAQKYWIGVLEGRIDAEDDAPDYPDMASLETLRAQVFALTEKYLRGASQEELNMARPMMTWGGNEKVMKPAHVFIRTLTHLYHHQGQITAMCRLMDKPVGGLDFPVD